VIDTVIMGNKRLWAAMEERDVIYAKAEMTDEDGMKLGELEGIVGEEDGYSAETDAAICCCRVWIFPMSCTSARWASCRADRRFACCWRRRLFGHPQALLLDEPTNHLDLDSIHWLQGFLNVYDGT
jgi:ATPase subunit of ABC transporter with duplicated ATPase domains